MSVLRDLLQLVALAPHRKRGDFPNRDSLVAACILSPVSQRRAA